MIYFSFSPTVLSTGTFSVIIETIINNADYIFPGGKIYLSMNFKVCFFLLLLINIDRDLSVFLFQFFHRI